MIDKKRDIFTYSIKYTSIFKVRRDTLHVDLWLVLVHSANVEHRWHTDDAKSEGSEASTAKRTVQNV